MSKHIKTLQELQSFALNPQSQLQIKGGGKDPYKEALKIQKKLMKQMDKEKRNMKKIMKYQDELDCLGFASLGCCGNGNGAW